MCDRSYKFSLIFNWDLNTNNIKSFQKWQAKFHGMNRNSVSYVHLVTRAYLYTAHCFHFFLCLLWLNRHYVKWDTTKFNLNFMSINWLHPYSSNWNAIGMNKREKNGYGITRLHNERHTHKHGMRKNPSDLMHTVANECERGGMMVSYSIWILISFGWWCIVTRCAKFK